MAYEVVLMVQTGTPHLAVSQHDSRLSTFTFHPCLACPEEGTIDSSLAIDILANLPPRRILVACRAAVLHYVGQSGYSGAFAFVSQICDGQD